MRFHLYPLSRAFSNRCVFDDNAQRFSVDRRPKRIEIYAFSNENALVWTGPQTRHQQQSVADPIAINSIKKAEVNTATRV